MADGVEITRKDVFKATVKEAGDFYKLTVTVAISFLGGTLLFAEKISAEPLKWSSWILYAGWLFLVLSICCVTWVRMKNIYSGTLVLCGKNNDAIQLDKKKYFITEVSFIFLVIGILLVLVFGGVNYSLKT